ncbi:MAG: glycosyltransferase [Clostridia bacterium]|nr:glycosyltransferase [Clostridia bacterium]
MNKINALSHKINSKTPKWLLEFFYSDLYIALVAICVFLSWFFDSPAIALTFISITVSVELIITRDIIPTLPAAIMAACIFPTGDFAKYLQFIPILIPTFLAAIFHIVVYPPRFRWGHMIIPQILVAISLLLGGIGSISKDNYLSAFIYVLFLGVFILIVYITYDAYYMKNDYIKPHTYLAKVLVWLGLIMCFQLGAFYIRHDIGLHNIEIARLGMNLGWGVDNSAGTILLLAAPMTFYLSISNSKKSPVEQLGYTLLGLLFYLFIFLSFSRGSIVFAVVTAPFVIVYALIKAKQKTLSIIPIVAIIILIAIFYGIYFDKFNSLIKAMFDNIVSGDKSQGWANRNLLYTEAINNFKANPIFGAGIGFKGDYYTPEGTGIYYIHSTFFQVIGTLGIVGFIAYSVSYVVRYTILTKHLKHSHFKVFALLSLIGFELYSLINTGTFVPYPMMTIVTFITLFVERYNIDLDKKQAKKNRDARAEIGDTKTRIAIVVGRSDIGGVTNSVMNFIRNIDKEKFDIDFYSYNDTKIKGQIEALGFKSYTYPIVFRFIKSIHALRKCFLKGKYDIVHVHMTTLSFVPLCAAEMAGIPTRICHAHSTSNIKESKWIIKTALKNIPKLYATHFVGCSMYACEWMYGKRFAAKRATVIKNAMDFARFNDKDKLNQAEIKKQFKLENLKVLGTIGRLEEQKNYEFLIDSFKLLHDVNPNVALAIVGDGKLMDKLINKIHEYNLDDFVFIYTEGVNVVECYKMFDAFVLPSLFEGLPNVVIEAQIMGLPCLISDNVTKECDITSNCKFIPITAPDIWAKEMNDILSKPKYDEIEKINMAGYNIDSEIKNLENYYMKCINE